jgi:hypothetical protein
MSKSMLFEKRTEKRSNALPRIQRHSRIMAWGCLLILAALPIVFITYWSTVSSTEFAGQGDLPPLLIQMPLQTWQRVSAATIMAVPLVMMLAGVWQARRCFLHFAHGQVFTAHVTRYLRNVARWIAAAVLTGLLSDAMATVVLTWTNAVGTRQLVFGMNSHHIFTLFSAAIVWLMAEVIAQGQSLVEENEGFI